MRTYELAFIVEPNTDEEGVTGVVDQVSQYIQTVDGAVTSVDVWGRKTLAYPINDLREGTYVLLNTDIPPVGLIDLERNLKLYEKIIRYMILVKQD